MSRKKEQPAEPVEPSSCNCVTNASGTGMRSGPGGCPQHGVVNTFESYLVED
jgi:hypothetical protein